MRRGALFLFFLFFLPVLLALPARAAEQSSLKEETDALLGELIEALPDGFTVDVTDTEALSEAVGVRGLLSFLLSVWEGERGEILSFFSLLLGCAAFFALAGALRESLFGTVGEVAEAAVSAVLAVTVFERLAAVTEGTVKGLSEANALFGALVPVMSAVTAAGGGAAASAAQAGVMGSTLSFLTAVSDRVLLPLSSVLFAMALLGALGGERGSPLALAGSVRGFFLWVLGGATAIFSAALSLQTVLTCAADSAAMRAARFAAADAIPLVGSAVSGALSSAATALSYVKSTVGVSAVTALLFLTLPLLLRLLLYRAAFVLAAAFLSYVGAEAGERVLGALRGALDALIAVTAFSLLLYIFEVVLFMKCGVAIA